MSTTEEGNKILAEFMGVEIVKRNGEDAVFLLPDAASPEYFRCTRYSMYHSRWEMLIPVWIKFRDLKFDNAKLEFQHSYWRSIIGNQFYFANSPIELFPHLVEAVKWYQSTKK